MGEEWSEFAGARTAGREGSRKSSGGRSEEALGAFEPKESAVIFVAGESFIAAFSRDENLDVGLGEASDVIESDSRRLADGLFHDVDVAGKERGEVLGVEGGFAVLGADAGGSEAGIGAFVGDLGVREANGEGA